MAQKYQSPYNAPYGSPRNDTNQKSISSPDTLWRLYNKTAWLSDMEKSIIVELNGHSFRQLQLDPVGDLRNLEHEKLITINQDQEGYYYMHITSEGRIVSLNIPHCYNCHVVLTENTYIQQRRVYTSIGCPLCELDNVAYLESLIYKELPLDYLVKNHSSNDYFNVGHDKRPMVAVEYKWG
jgi:hypothetical protein